MVNIGFLPYSVGGTEVYTFNLAKDLIERGHQVIVFTARNDLSFRQYHVIKEEISGIPVFSVVNSPFFSRSYLDYFLNPQIDQIFEAFLEEEKPDLIHFQHLAYLSGNLPEIAFNSKIPSVATIHDYWYLCFRSQLIKPDGNICVGPGDGYRCATCDNGTSPNPTAVPRYPELVQFINTPKIKQKIESLLAYMPDEMIAQARTFLFKRLNGGKSFSSNPSMEKLLENQFRVAHFKKQLAYPKIVISPSYHLKKRYEQEGYSNIKELPLGFHPVKKVDYLDFNGKLKLTFIGNLARHKGLHVILNELFPLLTQNLNFELNVYGHTNDSIYLKMIRTLAQKFPPGRIIFHGRYDSKKDMPHIFSNTHITIFPSVWEENHPLVLRESILYGIPVIASNLGGAPEIIKHMHNGLLFDPHNHGELAENLNMIYSNIDVLNNLRQNAITTEVETFDNHIFRLVNIYFEVLQNGNAVYENKQTDCFNEILESESANTAF
ncbi:MAG: glycosyltransferase [Chloroflexota bacterium]